ncbi:astrotactin-2-like protein, partial [Camelus ferus]
MLCKSLSEIVLSSNEIIIKEARSATWGGLIALLLLLLVFTVALYAQRRWQKRRRIPQKSASTEATHEIHYIPSVLLGPQARETFRSSRLQAHNSVIGVPIRETPILDDYDYEEEEDLPRRANHVSHEDEFGSQVTHTLDSLGRPGEEKGDFEKKAAAEVTQEPVESLMQKFKESFRANTPIEIGQLQPALRSASAGRRKRRSRSRGGISFGRTKGTSGSEADDETQLTFYTEQYRSRRRSKGLYGAGRAGLKGLETSSRSKPTLLAVDHDFLSVLFSTYLPVHFCLHYATGLLKSPVNKTALTLIAVSSCILAMVCGSQMSCPLTVKVTLHVPEHFIADGSSFVVSEGSYLDISDWLNPAKLSLYYQINATSPWVRDLCGQRTTDACEQLCDPETEMRQEPHGEEKGWNPGGEERGQGTTPGRKHRLPEPRLGSSIGDDSGAGQNGSETSNNFRVLNAAYVSGECSCHEGYAPDPVHRHLCVRSDWGQSEGPWPYTTLERGYDLVTGEQAPEKILRSTFSLGQGLWLPVSKSFVVPPVELSINPLASCKTDVLVTEDPADVRELCRAQLGCKGPAAQLQGQKEHRRELVPPGSRTWHTGGGDLRWMVKKLMKAICYSSGCGLHWANGLAFLWYISIQERVWDHEEENYEYED